MERQGTELANKHSDELAHWRSSWSSVVMLAQEIYALKTEARHGSLIDLKSEKAREEKIRKIWDEIADALKNYGEFQRESALIKLRVIQSQALSGNFHQHEVDSIDWKTAGMEQSQPMLLIQIYYKEAKNLLSKGREVEAVALLQTCRSLLTHIDPAAREQRYIHAMLTELSGDLHLRAQPKDAVKSYLMAIDKLRAEVNDMPASARLRNKLAQLCQNVSVLPSVDGDDDWLANLKQEAFKQASWLVKQDPQSKSAHLILAQLDIRTAEESLRHGELAKVDVLLKRSSQSLKLGGGDPVMQSWIEGMHAFMAWDKGYETAAMKLMDGQISTLASLVESDPSNAAACTRCAALLWVRSMMHPSVDNARSDELKALECLSSVLTGPASLQEISARRMSAMILCDLAEIEMDSGSKTKARDYLIRSEKLWGEMRLKWGVPDEDRVLVDWCSHQLKLL
jgi:hypothetical protein